MQLVQPELQRVKTLLDETMSIQLPGAGEISAHLSEAGGKNLRPLCVLLTGSACRDNGERQVSLAVILELIHTATLLHDDVVDNSSLRRGRHTINKVWSNAHGVLTGDYLYSKAFGLMANLNAPELFKNLADATHEVAVGELHQLLYIGRLSIGEAEYHQIIRRKTGALFSVACSGAALLADMPTKVQTRMGEFGMLLGTAFQITDDLLDYTGDPQQMGKNRGSDLTEGKITLPLIRAWEVADSALRKAIEECIRSGTETAQVMEHIRQSDALDYTRERAHELYTQACTALDSLPDNPHRAALHELAKFAVNRDR